MGDGSGARRQASDRLDGARRQDGSYKIVNECSLPYTGRGVVDRIITDLGVMDITPDGIKLVELAPDVTEDEIRSKTEPALIN